MKAEERHEFKENELAGWMYRLPFFLREYGAYFLLAIALLLFGYQAYNWYQTEKEKKRQQAWTEFMEASGQLGAAPADPGRLRAIINQFDIRELQALAYKTLGDYYLDGIDYGVLPGSNKSPMGRVQMEQEAFDSYNKVVTDYGDQLMPAGQAHLGLGRVYEDKEQWDQARKEYQILTDKNGPFAAMAIAAEAQRRLDKLGEWSQPVVFGPPSPAVQNATTLPGPMGPMLPDLTPSLEPATTMPR